MMRRVQQMSRKFRRETLVHRVILQPYIEKVSAGGIVISRDSRSQAINTDRGTVLMFGDKAWKDFGCDFPPVQVGDQVYYAKYGAKILEDPDNSDNFFVICNDEDILVGYTDDTE